MPKPFDVDAIRAQFPILKSQSNGKQLVYIDNTATTQKPESVIKRITDFYTNENATVHRGVYALSQKATETCESVRTQIAQFINAKSDQEIIFVKGTTEAINLVAHSYGKSQLTDGDEIVITEMEHHANIVPWKILCDEMDLTLSVIPMEEDGSLSIEKVKETLTTKTKIVALTHISNVLGSINPVKEIVKLSHDVGAKVLIDGAQSIAHASVDVQDLDCDFYCFSSHKMYGPTGIGVLYGKYELLKQMTPYQGGGAMIETVEFDDITYVDPPYRFEAGTPMVAQIVGLGAAFSFLSSLDMVSVLNYEDALRDYANEKLYEIEGLRIIGTTQNKAAIFSFVLDDIHPHDAGTILDTEGIAVRVGHHCAQPTMRKFKVPATIRASFSFYNTKHEVDLLCKGLQKVKDVML
jgi:cysteine desulfurase / selenocysteine lyase